MVLIHTVTDKNLVTLLGGDERGRWTASAGHFQRPQRKVRARARLVHSQRPPDTGPDKRSLIADSKSEQRDVREGN